MPRASNGSCRRVVGCAVVCAARSRARPHALPQRVGVGDVAEVDARGARAARKSCELAPSSALRCGSSVGRTPRRARASCVTLAAAASTLLAVVECLRVARSRACSRSDTAPGDDEHRSPRRRRTIAARRGAGAGHARELVARVRGRAAPAAADRGSAVGVERRRRPSVAARPRARARRSSTPGVASSSARAIAGVEADGRGRPRRTRRRARRSTARRRHRGQGVPSEFTGVRSVGRSAVPLAGSRAVGERGPAPGDAGADRAGRDAEHGRRSRRSRGRRGRAARPRRGILGELRQRGVDVEHVGDAFVGRGLDGTAISGSESVGVGPARRRRASSSAAFVATR